MATENQPAVEGAIITKREGMGAAIVTAASEAYQKEWQTTVVDGVKRLMLLRDEARDRIDHFTRAVEWYTRKIEALGAGRFELTRRGELVFEDAELNRGNF